MRPFLTAIAMVALLATATADAQSRGVRLPPPIAASPPPMFEFNTGFPGLIVVEREVPVVVEKEVVRDAGPPPPSAANPGTLNRDVPVLPLRKPYVIGASYASLPGGCMKLIEEGVSFYYCSGDWYRQVGEGRSASYKAVARRL